MVELEVEDKDEVVKEVADREENANVQVEFIVSGQTVFRHKHIRKTAVYLAEMKEELTR